jgi:hypothetical protein
MWIADFFTLTFFLPWRSSPSGPRPPHYRGFMIPLRHTTLGTTPLDEWSARRRDLYLTTHNTHNRQTSMPPGGIRTHNPSKQAAADPRLRPLGHWDRLSSTYIDLNMRKSHTLQFRYCYNFAKTSWRDGEPTVHRQHHAANLSTANVKLDWGHPVALQ